MEPRTLDETAELHLCHVRCLALGQHFSDDDELELPMHGVAPHFAL
jgi:hypothetical protein